MRAHNITRKTTRRNAAPVNKPQPRNQDSKIAQSAGLQVGAGVEFEAEEGEEETVTAELQAGREEVREEVGEGVREEVEEE